MPKTASKKAKTSASTLDTQFDPGQYVRAPIIDVPGGVGLGCALIAAAQKGAPAPVKKAAESLRRATLELRDSWASAHAASGKQGDAKAADMAIDNAWAALFARLDAYASLPEARHPRSPRAAALRDRLFPGGLAFLKLAYAEEWAESDKRLTTIEREWLEGEIDSLAGPEFLAELRVAHKAYGEVLGITRAAKQSPAPPSFADLLRSLQRAIGGYALQWSAAADADPRAIPLAKSALRPIDDFRSAGGRRASQNGSSSGTQEVPAPEPATPSTPVPSLPK